ncbi:hypothetical protein L0244_24565, partial [bacterium]|nr:hypothetical protein [bacterium]
MTKSQNVQLLILHIRGAIFAYLYLMLVLKVMRFRTLSMPAFLTILVASFFIIGSAEIRETNPIQQKLSQRKVGNEPLYEVESLLKF